MYHFSDSRLPSLAPCDWSILIGRQDFGFQASERSGTSGSKRSIKDLLLDAEHQPQNSDRTGSFNHDRLRFVNVAEIDIVGGPAQPSCEIVCCLTRDRNQCLVATDRGRCLAEKCLFCKKTS
jgi:hypothetical protein